MLAILAGLSCRSLRRTGARGRPRNRRRLSPQASTGKTSDSGSTRPSLKLLGEQGPRKVMIKFDTSESTGGGESADKGVFDPACSGGGCCLGLGLDRDLLSLPTLVKEGNDRAL